MDSRFAAAAAALLVPLLLAVHVGKAASQEGGASPELTDIVPTCCGEIADSGTITVPGTLRTTGADGRGRIIHAYTVSLRRRSDLGYFCAGVLISKRHVLTAAHCVDLSRTSTDGRPQVVVGSPSSRKTTGEGVQVIPTKEVFIHPDFVTRRVPDLAVLELASDANQTPVRLPTAFVPRRGDILEAIGWGRTSTSSGNSELVQVASMDFIPRIAGCVRRNGPRICMGGKGVSSCNGDNGGPVVLPGSSRREDTLVSIMGASHVCGATTRPDMHTNVWPFVQWIQSIIGTSG